MVFSEMGRALAGAAATVTMTTAVKVTAHARRFQTIPVVITLLLGSGCGSLRASHGMCQIERRATVNLFTAGSRIDILVMTITALCAMAASAFVRAPPRWGPFQSQSERLICPSGTTGFGHINS